ncbi:MAG: hypothetical protein OER12_01510 [Acidimicrobiia bacterium]|nr:hypothetical protein [Acidimicrobiia bacterium]
MIENPGDVMNVVFFVGTALFLLAAAVSALTKRWKIKAITQRRERAHEALRARTVPVGDGGNTAEEFAAVDRRIEAVLAELSHFKASQRSGGVSG